MIKRKGFAGVLMIITMIVVGAALLALPVVGYVKNVAGFTRCDFETPYKAEIIRGTGILFPPVGMIAGYVDIKDGEVK